MHTFLLLKSYSLSERKLWLAAQSKAASAKCYITLPIWPSATCIHLKSLTIALKNTDYV